MQLTLYTDYSLRVLVYLMLMNEKPVTITEIAEYYNVSRNHLVKIVHNLGLLGYITTMRGKGGGMTLARPPESINIGEVVRKVEPNFNIVECFSDDESKACRIEPVCKLKRVLQTAAKAFLDELDNYTLKDVLQRKSTSNVPFESIIPISLSEKTAAK